METLLYLRWVRLELDYRLRSQQIGERKDLCER